MKCFGKDNSICRNNNILQINLFLFTTEYTKVCKWYASEVCSQYGGSVFPSLWEYTSIVMGMCFHRYGNTFPMYWEMSGTILLLIIRCLRRIPHSFLSFVFGVECMFVSDGF